MDDSSVPLDNNNKERRFWDFISRHKKLLGINNMDDIKLDDINEGTVFYKQYYKNLPVYNTRIDVSAHNGSNRIGEFGSRVWPNINISIIPKLDSS